MQPGSGLLGRDAELAQIDAAIVAAGTEVVAITGEPGIGKSALLAELARRAEVAGLSVLAGRAAEHERDVPFGLVVDALDDQVAALHRRRFESLGPERLAELAAVLPAAAGHAPAGGAAAGPAERFLYHRALRALLELLGGERPVALLLDDLHWADDGSLELVLHLLRRPPRTPLLLAVALRRTDARPGPGPAPRLLDALRGVPDARLLALEPLPAAAALELLDGVPGAELRERLREEAGGNPLYLRELARAAATGGTALPPTLVATVQQEVASLPPASRALLDGAAVAGDPFDPELAAAAAALEPDDAPALLDRLVAADLVRPAGGRRGFRFRHPVVRLAVYEATAPGWRLGAHERTAAALAARGKGAVAQAYHVEQAARPGDAAAVELLARAAAESADTSPASAARWYTAALELLPADDPRRGDLLGAVAGALAAAGRLEKAREAILDALENFGGGAADSDRSARRLTLVAACAQLEHVLGRHADADRRLRAALDALPPGAPPHVRAGLELELATGSLYAGDAAAVFEWSGRALDTAGEADPAPAATAHALRALGATWSLRGAEAEPPLRRAAELVEELTDQQLAARMDALYALTAAYLFAERFPESDAAAARALEISRAFHQDRLLAPLSIFRSMAVANMCRLPEGLQLAEAAEEAARMQGLRYQEMWALWQRAQLLDVAGTPLEAQRVAAQCQELIESVEPSLVTRTGACNIATLRLDSDPAGCMREMVEAGGEELELVDPVWATYLMRAMVQAALATGETEEADRWAARLEKRAEMLGLPASAVRAATARAAVLDAEGEHEAAAKIAAAAADAADAAGATMDGIHGRLVAGAALAPDATDRAISELQRAAADAARGGAIKLRDAAARELRRLGARIPAAVERAAAGHAAGLAELTDREREIVELAAGGRTNKQIAATLYLSEKTIESHLSRIFSKLGVRSRVELAGLVARDRS
jgi:predicted ATPase/DNA-binding NarL/FixJ family response regulator